MQAEVNVRPKDIRSFPYIKYVIKAGNNKKAEKIISLTIFFI